ncbi:MAG: hypothetical protein L3J28_00230 [Candidatus Polarisedimenticolaceae bacterium]|nr:hypothetical protein [Candidatus Polarisedimenticolaceae bacterium]
MNLKKSAWLKLAVIPLVGVLAACGGGGSSSSSDTSDTTTVTGSVVAAPVHGASVVFKDAGGNTIAGPVLTQADGSYSVPIPNAYLAAELIFESTGGTFDDEATGFNRNAGLLAAHIAAGSLSGGSEVHMTPATTIVRHMVETHGITLDTARTAFEAAFGFPADFGDAPVDATDPAIDATDAELLAGVRAATFSQLTMDLGLTVEEQFDLLVALAEDLADGTLDGEGAGGAVMVGATPLTANIQSQFTLALQNFLDGNDRTGLLPTQIGSLPFAKNAHSASYRFEYVAGMMAAMEGKTQFKVIVTDAATGLAADGLALSLAAKMHMESMTHMTPVDGCSESSTAGTYNCTLYYLMPSVMGDVSMGYWELMVTADATETVKFFPPVVMGMNGNGKHQLKGQLDLIPGMMAGMTEQRTYYLFKDSIAGTTGNHNVRLFAAVKESMMMLPKLFLNETYSAGTTYVLTANPIAVEFSTDGTNWSPMTDESDGYWNITGVTGLTDGVENTFQVRLTVNSEQKTTDGLAPALDGTNDYAIFTTTL